MDPRRAFVHRVLRSWLRTNAAMRKLGRGLRREHGLSEIALLLLRVIAEAEPLSLGELSELTGQHVASVGQMIERMEEAGWVERQRDETDRRRVLVRTTERGRQTAASSPLFGPWRLGALAASLTEEQLEKLGGSLDWLSRLFSPPEQTEEDPMPCGTRHGFGRRMHFDFSPGSFQFDLGSLFGQFGQGFGFARQFTSRREKLEKLERYLQDLKSETEAVQEQIDRLREEMRRGPDSV